jgi:hypothetical protein
MPQHQNYPSIPDGYPREHTTRPHDRASLRTLLVHALHHGDRLEQIPLLFPNIVHLRFPNSISGHSIASDSYSPWCVASLSLIHATGLMWLHIQDGWLKLLPQFRHLQVFRGTGIWEMLRQSQGKLDYHEAMESIAKACPKLRHLDYVGKAAAQDSGLSE